MFFARWNYKSGKFQKIFRKGLRKRNRIRYISCKEERHTTFCIKCCMFFCFPFFYFLFFVSVSLFPGLETYPTGFRTGFPGICQAKTPGLRAHIFPQHKKRGCHIRSAPCAVLFCCVVFPLPDCHWASAHSSVACTMYLVAPCCASPSSVIFMSLAGIR